MNKTRDVRLFIQHFTRDVTVWRICIIASLTAFVNAAMNASMNTAMNAFYYRVMGSPSVSLLVAIKGRGEAFARSTKV